MRTIADVDPEEWGALWTRRWQMYLDGISPDRYHDDAEGWARLDALRTRATFFIEAARAPEVLRLIARYRTPSFPFFFFSLHLRLIIIILSPRGGFVTTTDPRHLTNIRD